MSFGLTYSTLKTHKMYLNDSEDKTSLINNSFFGFPPKKRKAFLYVDIRHTSFFDLIMRVCRNFSFQYKWTVKLRVPFEFNLIDLGMKME